MVREVIEERDIAIRQKERELVAHEEAYYQHKRQLEEKELDLNDRCRRFSRALEEEQSKMTLLLNGYKAHPNEADDFYRYIQYLQEESERCYRYSIQRLDEEKADVKHRFNQERDQLETQLQWLRRQEDGTTR